MAKRTRSATAKLTAGVESGSFFVRHGVRYQPARLRQRTRELMAYVKNPDMLLNETVFLKDEPLPDDPWIDKRKEMGTGPDGERYYSVVFNGKYGVMKECCDILKDRGAFSLLVKEVCMFNVLQDLQGKSLARLLGFGFASAREFFLVHSWEGPRILTEVTYSVLDSAERSLSSLHKRGWLLGDIQPANFAMRNDRVKLTCLMHCEPLADYNRMDMERELHSLRMMLARPLEAQDGKEDTGKNDHSLEQEQPSTEKSSLNKSGDYTSTMCMFPPGTAPLERASDCSSSLEINQPAALC